MVCVCGGVEAGIGERKGKMDDVMSNFKYVKNKKRVICINKNYECAIGFVPDTREKHLLLIYLFNILFIISVLFNNLNSVHCLFLLGAQHYLTDHCLTYLFCYYLP